jgi:hypothetical protein
MRDICRIPFSPKEDIILGTDNSGGIGTKEADFVQADDSLTAYFSARVSLMEVLSAKGTPFAILLHNFSGDDRWEQYKEGIETAIEEAGIGEIPITGSSESNFPLQQSALGITVLAKTKTSTSTELPGQRVCYAVIGQPLVGSQVLEQKDKAAPLSLFTRCCQSSLIMDMIPVGSKGILEELKVLSNLKELTENQVTCELDIKVSGGPSTSFIIRFAEKNRYLVEGMTGSFYHPLLIVD